MPHVLDRPGKKGRFVLLGSASPELMRSVSETLAGRVAIIELTPLPALGLTVSTRRLRQLWTMLTHVHGSLLNVSDLARSLAVSSPTVVRDLDILEGGFMIRRLPPFYANVQKSSLSAIRACYTFSRGCGGPVS